MSRPLKREGKRLNPNDPGKIDPATERITAVSHKLAELMYKKQQEEASAKRRGGWSRKARRQSRGILPQSDDVIDAEFTEQK